MKETVLLALIGSVTSIIVAALPIILARSSQSGADRAAYPWMSVLAGCLSIVAIITALFPRTIPKTKILWAQTEPSYESVKIESSLGAQFGIKDFGGMFRYTLTFGEPVDVVVPQQLSYTNQWVLWKVEKHPEDQSGRRWVVSFQHPKPSDAAVAGSSLSGTAQASFIGLKFPE